MPFETSSLVMRDKSLKNLVMLRAGGNAEYFAYCSQIEDLANLSIEAQKNKLPTVILGYGSNVLPSDHGIKGVVLYNQCSRIEIQDQEVIAEAGCSFQELFLKTAQAGLRGLEFAVGIPGTWVAH